MYIRAVTRAISQPPPRPRPYSPVRSVVVERAASPIRPPPPPPRFVRMPSPVTRTESEVKVVEEYYTAGKPLIFLTRNTRVPNVQLSWQLVLCHRYCLLRHLQGGRQCS